MNTITIIIVKNEEYNFCTILQISLQSQQLCCAKFGFSASDLFLASICRVDGVTGPSVVLDSVSSPHRLVGQAFL